MADQGENNGQQNNPAARGGRGGGRGRGRGATTTQTGPSRATQFLNPENVPDVIAKYRKELGKTIAEIVVKYTAEGTTVKVIPMGSLVPEGTRGDVAAISVAEYNERLRAAKASAPRGDERSLDDEFKFIQLYQKRLGKDLPEPRPTSYDEVVLKRWVLAQPFEDRKVLMMNAKEFRNHQRAAGAAPAAEGEEN